MDTRRPENVVWQPSVLTQGDRERALGQRGAVVWFTGLSGSGKSTISHAVEAELVAQGAVAYVLDGDNLRHGLNADLGFGPADRAENIRRVGAVAALFADAGVICLTALISPYRADRDAARARVPAGRFFEVFVDTPLSLCEARDPKGLYAKAREGKIPEFTGISAPYEAPERPELRLRTEGRTVQDVAREVTLALAAAGIFRPGDAGVSLAPLREV